ncbi:MAG TPA: NusA-like transcription termination signal-binding factor, partial [Nitrososphaera sp.]|nr:NusA-like transcription termination signal-binding factor [Nitrososphaera sp.]
VAVSTLFCILPHNRAAVKMTEIKLTSDELRLMSLFQSITSATARDCIVDDKMDRVIFVVNKGQMGLAIGKGGSTIKQLQNMVAKKIELVEFSYDPAEFVRNMLNADMINDVRISERSDGTKQAVVTVDPRKKGAVVGREGRNAEKARLLARRYFQISNVLIVGPEQGNSSNRVNIDG